MRIFVVEDEQIIAADLANKLTKLGHEVVGQASSGEEAISMASELRPELVFMDVRLQGVMDGTEAGRIIQAQTGAPIVFLTAYAAVFLRSPNKMPPPGLCLTKPFSVRQLESVLAAAK